MRLSDTIESFIKAMIQEDQPEVELKRNELAEYFHCAPSQINYVLATRFTLDHGYVTSSQRGGGGYIRIVRKRFPDGRITLMHALASVGDAIRAEDARILIVNLVENGIVSPDVGRVMTVAVSDSEIDPPERDVTRARRLKRMLIALSD